MERLKYMKETLMNCVQGQLGDLSSVDAGELGAAIDMIKDLEEAIYYCTIVKSMEEKSEEKQKYYPYIYDYNMPDTRYMDMSQGRMYYEGQEGNGNEGRDGRSSNGRRYADGGSNSSSSNSGGGMRQYPLELRDSREGISPMTRRKYMESKEMHKGKELRMQELDRYMHELTHDVTEMINDASPEEKQMLQEKLTKLAHKIV